MTAFLVSGLGTQVPEVIGEPDADWVPYLPMFRQGLAVYGPRNAVDKVVKGARMHP